MSVAKPKITRNVVADQQVFDNLKSKGIQLCKFFRQAVKAYDEGKWVYDYNLR